MKKKANKKAVGLSETHPLVLNEDFGKVGFAIEDQGKLVDYMLGHIKRRRENIEDTREHLLETPEMVFGLEVLLQHTYQLSNIQEGGIFDMIIQDRKKSESTQELLKNVGLSALAIAAGLLTFGGGTLAFVGASAAAGVSIYEAREEMIKYNRDSAAHDLGFDLDDPSMLWVVIAVAGAGLDLASVGSTIKGVSRYLKQFSKSAKATDDLSKLKKGLTKLEKTNAKLKNALEQAAGAEARLASVVTGSMRKAYNIHHAFADAVEIAYLFAKKKMNGFRAYLLELKRVGLIENIDKIAPGAMKNYKEAFELGQQIEREGLGDVWEELYHNSSKIDEVKSQLREEVARRGRAGARGGKISEFENLTHAEKLKKIEDGWKAYYPEIFSERKFFEDLARHYRYPKSSGFGHTGDIAPNFKALDFYENFTEVGNKIYAKKAISMKSTTTKNVDNWLNSNPIKKNLDNLQNNLGATKGIKWNNKTIYYNKAQVDIYMPKGNLTPELKAEWLEKLSKERPEIDFTISTLEEFIK